MTKPGVGISLAAIALLMLGPVAASAKSCTSVQPEVALRNQSDRDAWVDVSWAYKTTRWNIFKTFCLTPKSQYGRTHQRFNYPELGPQIRVRAYVKQGDCRSGNYRNLSGDIRDIKTNGGRNCLPQILGTITGSNGSYTLRMSQQY